MSLYVNIKLTNLTLTALLCRLFGISCSDVYGKLVSQIKAWQIRQSCLYAGETCSYEVRNICILINNTLGVYKQVISVKGIHIFSIHFNENQNVGN